MRGVPGRPRRHGRRCHTQGRQSGLRWRTGRSRGGLHKVCAAKIASRSPAKIGHRPGLANPQPLGGAGCSVQICVVRPGAHNGCMGRACSKLQAPIPQTSTAHAGRGVRSRVGTRLDTGPFPLFIGQSRPSPHPNRRRRAWPFGRVLGRTQIRPMAIRAIRPAGRCGHIPLRKRCAPAA